MVGLKSKAFKTTKEYRDGIISQISGEGEGCVFTSADESKVSSTVDDVAKDFEYGKASYAPDATGNPNFEKFDSGKRHSFEHAVMPCTEAKGQYVIGMPVMGKTDSVADKNKKVS